MNGKEGDLRGFIEAAMAKGASDRFLADLLKASGWADKEIFAAFRGYYEQAAGVALPIRRESGESARDAFLYLIAFSTLATWTIALGAILFRIIDIWLPDPVALRGGYNVYADLNLSYQIACVLVAFPVFLYVSRTINRVVAEEPRNRNSGVRKWLTYLALVIAAGVLIGDAVTVLAYLLQGEVTLRFIFKAIVVGIIGAGVFGYYLGEVGAGVPDADLRRHRFFSIAATAAVALGIVLGLTATGGPSRQRALQADEQRTRDLHQLAGAISSAVHFGAPSIPETLEQVPAARGMTDPETRRPYEYNRLSGMTYELCATFTHDNRREARSHRNPFWLHASGRQCFQFDVKQPMPSPYSR